MTEVHEEQELVQTNDDDAAEYIQEQLEGTDVKMTNDEIKLVIEHYYGYLATLGLVEGLED